MRRLRTLALAALLTSLSLGPSPASAVPAVLVFTGNAHISCFGCGVPSPCSANLSILGVTHSGSATTTACSALEPVGVLCLVTGTADGTVVGTSGTAVGLSINFAWTRVGVVAVITTTGGFTGHGEAVFIPLAPVCGAPMEATVAGWVGGI